MRRRLEEILLGAEADPRRLLRRCALAALLLVALAYPDVIFRGASLSVANFVNVTVEPRPERVRLIPERRGREAYHGYYDAGGGAFQSEPGAQFMARALWSGQSVFWNPYSAAGSYGPETLVDVKTSPHSMAVALLGGGDRAFHLAYLGFTWLGVFCLLALLALELRLPLLAALAGGATYLLNGYNVANLGSNFSQTWLYFPVLAFALVRFANRPRVGAFLGIAAGAALILSTTFLPTTLVILGTTLFVGAAAALGNPAAARRVGGQFMGVLLALLLLAVVYLPVFEALRYMDTGEYYGARRFHPATLFNFISLFTPKHAFEAYNAISQRAAELRGNVAFHQGIVGALLALQALRAWPVAQHRVLLLAMGAALLLLLARIYGLPGLAAAADALPVIGNLGQQYLWAGVAILFTLLVPFGVQALVAGGVRPWPLAGGAIAVTAALAYTTLVLGFESRAGMVYVAIAGLLVAAATILLLRLRPPDSRALGAMLLVVLSWGELTFYVNHYRLSRTDRFSEPPAFVRFLQAQGGQHRVASYGPWGIPPEYGSAYGIYQIESMNFHLNPRYEALFNRLILPDPADRWTGFITLNRARDTDRLDLAAYDFLGASRIVVPVPYPRLRGFMERSGWARVYADAHFLIFENPGPLPRAFVAPRLAAARGTPLELGQSPLAVALSEDARLLEQARKLGVPAEGGPSDAARARAAIERYDHDRVEIAVELAQPGILVLTDAWHPNWSVKVDGEPRHLGVVDGAFRGVALPPGRHRVEMSYAPRTLQAGRLLSLFGLLLALSLFALRRRFERWFG